MAIQTTSKVARSVLAVAQALALVGGLSLGNLVDRPAHAGELPARATDITPGGTAATSISGRAFNDFNSNGVMDTGSTFVETPAAGITVQAFAAGQSTAAAIAATDATGNYALTGLVAGARYRVEFSNLPAGSYNAPHGASGSATTPSNGSSVQFAGAGSANVSFALLRPCDYCQTGPLLAVNYFLNGDPLQGGSASGQQSTVIFPYRSGAQTGLNKVVAKSQNTGATWGLAYQRSSRSVFHAALMKRHVGLGPLGIGGIYKTQLNGSTPTTSPFVDLSALGLDLGTDPRVSGDLSADLTEPNYDPAAFDAVGKIGFGDIDISEDERTLWAINLKTRELLEIFIDLPARAPTASDIKRHPLPAVNCTNGVFRPWALETHNNTIYVGGVCSGESAGATAAHLSAHIFAHDSAGATGSFAPVFTIALNYPRGDISLNVSGRWRPWINNWAQMGSLGGHVIWPQPILSDIEFDDDGSLILGIQDRIGHQGGNNNYSTIAGSSRLYETIVGGDLLRACPNGSGFALENNAACGGVTTAGANTNAGPGNGEFYFGESWAGYHTEISLGSLALLPGTREIVSTVFDPLTDYRTTGVVWFNSLNGKRNESYEVSSVDYLGRPGSFGKAAGLGDIETLCDPAPIEIGNRLWIDTNQNGAQDANEASIVNTTVSLYDANGVKIGSVKTNGNGEYYFRSPRTGEAAGTIDAGSTLLSAALAPNTVYSIRLDNPADFDAGGPLNGFALTQQNAASNTLDSIDSDGAPLQTSTTGIGLGGVPGLYPVITHTTGVAGQSDHTLDFGFAAPVEIGNQVWFDTNNNSMIDAAERGAPGVTVHLFAVDPVSNQILPTPIATNTTTADGFYLFTQTADGALLYGGTFVIGIAPANFAAGGALAAYHSSGVSLTAATTRVDATTVDTDLNIDNDDDGATVFAASPQVAFYLNGVLSRPITVSAGLEPAGESSTNAQGATATGLTPGVTAATGDRSSNLSVDFGFYAQIIGNKVAYDANNSGIQEFGEPALNGMRVRLLDVAGNEIPVGLDGILGTADDALGGTLTADDPADNVPGAYYFKGLPAGDYIVEVERPPEYRSSTGSGSVLDDPVANPALESNVIDPDNNINKDDNGYETGANNRIRSLPVTLAPASNPNLIAGDSERGVTNDHRVDFSIYRYVDATLYSVGNRLWFDVNNDGLQNLAPYQQTDSSGTVVTIDEMALNRVFDGVKARIYPVDAASAINGAALQTITIDAGGYYRFDNLSAGDYKIVVETPAGFLPTTGGSSATPNDDVAGDDNAAARSTVSATLQQVTYPGGFVESGPITLGNEAEPLGTTGEISNTYGPGDALLQASNDSRTNLNVDFGFIRARAMNLGNQVYDDLNDNGQFEPALGDTPIDGVIVRLLKFNRSTGEYDAGALQVTRAMDVVSNTTLGIAPGTQIHGAYLFDGLTPGDYIVELAAGNFISTGVTKVNGVDVPNGALIGYRSSTGSGGAANSGPAEYPELDVDSAIETASDDTTDVGLEKRDGTTRMIRSNPVTLAYDSEPNQSPTGEVTSTDEELPRYNTNTSTDDTNSNLVVDFAVFRAYAIGNRVFFDGNNSGALDYASDVYPAASGGTDTPGITGVTVTLHLANGTVIVTTTTDANGRYLFDNLLAGSYVVQIDAANFASGAALAPRGIAFTSSDDIGTSAGPDNDIDSDDNGAPTDGGVRSGTLTLGPGPVEPAEDAINNDLDARLGHGQFAPDAQSNLSVDFGFYEPVRLGNLVWEDANNNGAYDAGETPIAGVPVYLYRDSNNDGEPDGTSIAETQTAPGGVYTFTVQPGVYVVEIAPGEIAALSVFTSSSGRIGSALIGTNSYGDSAIDYESNVPDPDMPANLNPDGEGVNNDDNGFVAPNGRIRSKPITMISSQETVNDVFDEPRDPIGYPFDSRNYSVDFGLYQPLSLGNLVWNDIPDLGVYQGEQTPGIDGVTVTLYADTNGNGLLDPAELETPVMTDLTRAGGRYLFRGLPAGEFVTALDASNFVEGAQLFGYISSDRADTGISGSYEPAPDPDAPIDEDGNPDNAGSVRDNDDSATLFGTLGAGGALRSAQVSLRAGTEPIDEAAVFDNDLDTPNANENLTIDFGVYTPYSLGNRVWLDSDGNGLRDAGEPPLANVNINLRFANGALYDTTYSDADGHYRFDALVANDWFVEIDASNFVTGFELPLTGEVITPLLGLLSSGISASDPNTDFDSDDNGIGTWPDLSTGVRSGVITLGPGVNEPVGEVDLKAEALPQGALLDGIANMTVDFGFVRAASLGNRVWLDQNQDGIQNFDANGAPIEPDVAGITVTLHRAGTPVSSMLTSLTGTYRFDNLEPGVPYSVSFVLPVGYRWVQQHVQNGIVDSNVDPLTNATGIVVLGSGEYTPTLDAGLFLPPELELRKTVLDPGPIKSGDELTYQIVVRNTSAVFAGNVTIIDPIPARTRYVDNSAQPAAALSNGELIWRAVDLQPGESTTVTFRVAVNADVSGVTSISNVARLRAAAGAVTLNSNEVQNPFGPTAITLDVFGAAFEVGERAVGVNWSTSLERDTLGFNLWRGSGDSRVSAAKINSSLIPAKGNGQGGAYRFADAGGFAGANYWLEEVEISGNSNWYGSVRVAMPETRVLEALQTTGGVRLPQVALNAGQTTPAGFVQLQSVTSGNAQTLLGERIALAKDIQEPAAANVPAVISAAAERSMARIDDAPVAQVVQHTAQGVEAHTSAAAAASKPKAESPDAPKTQLERTDTVIARAMQSGAKRASNTAQLWRAALLAFALASAGAGMTLATGGLLFVGWRRRRMR